MVCHNLSQKTAQSYNRAIVVRLININSIIRVLETVMIFFWPFYIQITYRGAFPTSFNKVEFENIFVTFRVWIHIQTSIGIWHRMIY